MYKGGILLKFDVEDIAIPAPVLQYIYSVAGGIEEVRIDNARTILLELEAALGDQALVKPLQ